MRDEQHPVARVVELAPLTFPEERPAPVAVIGPCPVAIRCRKPCPLTAACEAVAVSDA